MANLNRLCLVYFCFLRSAALLILLLWFRLPEGTYRVVYPAEFVISAAMVAAGILLRRSAVRKLSFTDYIIALAGTSIAVVAVYTLYGWIRLPK